MPSSPKFSKLPKRPTFFMSKQAIGAALYEPLLAPLLSSMRQHIVRLALPHTLPRNFRLLDCCCGAGGLLTMTAQAMHVAKGQDMTDQDMTGQDMTGQDLTGQNLTGQGGACIGLDMDAHMLAQCQKYTAPFRSCVHLMRADATHLPFTSQSIHTATLCMALHTMPLDTAFHVLKEMHRVAQCVIIADYCLAERNLSLPAAAFAHTLESIAGGSHYANYKVFMQQGGLEGFLHKAGYKIHERHTVSGGVVRIVRLQHSHRMSTTTTS